ncbi:unnamed protein product [Psylliodes chrysocephalus]|uniref:Uncharacterized protein n=1 Tax=Psylliodes chrysocephalus TaxID=3402493 RepID=A0A9P0DBQ3_9CUCU|nr:unnamed protein product [Psylliodes chrysocephala]
MCLRLLLGYNDSPISPPKEVAKILQCQQPYALMGPVFGSPKCAFPGGDILEHIIHFQQFKQEFEVIVEDFRYKGWLNNFNIQNCFSNTAHVESVTSSLSRIREDLIELKADLNLSLQKVYDKYTTEEWLESYFNPLESQVEALWSAKNKLLSQKVWRKRPFKQNRCDL